LGAVRLGGIPCQLKCLVERGGAFVGVALHLCELLGVLGAQRFAVAACLVE
jgi:hypothetical protein